MGTTSLALAFSVVVALLPLLRAYLSGGLPEMKAHWKANAVWSVGTLVSAWASLIAFASVRTIYNDHIRSRASIVALTNQISGPGGYERKLSDATTQISGLLDEVSKARSAAQLARAQFETLSASRLLPSRPVESPRDPDGLYQYGILVGSLVGERVDDANGVIDFQVARTDGHFNKAEDTDFRNYRVRCDTISGGPPQGVVVGNYVGMTVGGFCRIVGKN
jgi:hypothetical protein